VPKNYYALLGVARNATNPQIRDRFRLLARQRHPDRFHGQDDKARAEQEFQELTEAFNVLTHPERRRQHDLELSRPEAGQLGVDSRQLARVYLQRGARAYREKNYLEAADNFDRATKAEPGNALAWHNLALACGHQQRWLGRAMDAAAQACLLEPMNATYLRTAGRVFARAGVATRAEQFFNEALAWGGDDEAVRAELEQVRQGRRSRPPRPGKAE
jgi:curved DNA-binding protein CbpA